MASKAHVSSSTRKLDDLKNEQELRLRQEGAALSRTLEPMQPMQQMAQQTVIGCQEMIAWFVPLSAFRPGALTFSEMSCSEVGQRSMKISLAFLLAMVSQPAMGRVAGKLMMGTTCLSERAMDSRGVKQNDVDETYNRFKTVAIWLTKDSIDANAGPRELMMRHHNITYEAALARLPPRFAPVPMTRDNVVGMLFISVIRDPEASFARALEMTIRENQFLRDMFTVPERNIQNVRTLCENVYEAGTEARLTESEMFSLLFHPEQQRAAACAATADAVNRVIQMRATERLQKWREKQEAAAQKLVERRDGGQDVDESELEDTSPAACERKRAEFAKQIGDSLDRKTIPLWRLMQSLDYQPDFEPDSPSLPEALSSQQRLLRDVLISNSARRLPAEVSITNNSSINPAETGAHARVFITSFEDYVDFVLAIHCGEVSDRQRQIARNTDTATTHYTTKISPLIDPVRHLTLERALEAAKAAGAHTNLLKLSNFVAFDGVIFDASLRDDHVKFPLTGPFSVPRVIMTRRPGSSADSIPKSADINVVPEGANRIPDTAGIFKLALQWPEHTSVFRAGCELFEFNENAQFPHTVDDFPQRAAAALDVAILKLSSIAQETVNRAEAHVIESMQTAYRILVHGDESMFIKSPRTIEEMRRQSFNISIKQIRPQNRNMTDAEFMEKFAGVLQCKSGAFERMMDRELFGPGILLRQRDDPRQSACSLPNRPHSNQLTAEEVRIRGMIAHEKMMKNFRQTPGYAKISAYSDDAQALRQQEGETKRASTHQLYHSLLPLHEQVRLLMVLDPAMWRQMLGDMRRYCLDQYARVYYAGAPANGLALRSIAKWERCCYTGVPFGPQTVGTGMSMFGTFMSTTLAFNAEIGGITNSPAIATDLLMMRGDVFRMSTQMGIHPMLVGPAALGKTSLVMRVADWSIPMTYSSAGSSSAKANKDLGVLRMAFSMRIMDEPQHCLTHGTKNDTSRESDEEFSAMKRLLGDSGVSYARSVMGHGTQNIEVNVRISLICTANELLYPKENSLTSRLWPTFCEFGDRQGINNTLIVRTLQPPSIKASTAMNSLRTRWRHHQHFVGLMSQLSDCGGCLPPNVILMGILTTVVFQRVGGLIPGATHYPRLGGMALAIATQHAFTRAFCIFSQTNEERLSSQWREGVPVDGVDNRKAKEARDSMSEDGSESELDDADEDRNADEDFDTPRDPYDLGVDWVKTAGQDAKHIRTQFDISTINKMSPYAVLTSEMAMFTIVQMIDRVFPVHLHAVLYTLAVSRGNWAPGILDFLLGRESRECNMSMFNDTQNGGNEMSLREVHRTNQETGEQTVVRYVLDTFPRTAEGFGRTKMPIFWACEEQHEYYINNHYGANVNGLLEHVKFASHDGHIDPNYIDVPYNFGMMIASLRSMMANTQNPTDQALRYMLTYCQNGQSNVFVPVLQRVSNTAKGVLMPDDIKFATEPGKTIYSDTKAVMHSVPAVQIIGSGQDRRMRISTLFLMLGSERVRIMNMYALLEDRMTVQDSRMIIPRTVPGQSNLYQTIRMNKRPGHAISAFNPFSSSVVSSNGAVSMASMNMQTDVPMRLPSGLNIRAELAPSVTSILNNAIAEEINTRLNNWMCVNPRLPGESTNSYNARNSILLSNCQMRNVNFAFRPIDDECALAHLQLNGLTYEEALPYLPSATQHRIVGHDSVVVSFNIRPNFLSSPDDPVAPDDPEDRTIMNIGTADSPVRTTIADMRTMLKYFADVGQLLYPDHFIMSRDNLDLSKADIVLSTVGSMASENLRKADVMATRADEDTSTLRRKSNRGGRRVVTAGEGEMTSDTVNERTARALDLYYSQRSNSVPRDDAYDDHDANYDDDDDDTNGIDDMAPTDGMMGISDVPFILN